MLLLSERWLWLVGSLLLATLWTNLAWFFRKPRPGLAGEAIAGLVAWPLSPWLYQVFRLLYYVGVPFAALLWGRDAVIGRFLGLQRLELPASLGEAVSSEAINAVNSNWIDWAYDAGWAAALGLGASVVLILAWWTYRRAWSDAELETPPAEDSLSGWGSLREAACHEIHWAFYRSAPIVALGVYWGSWAGLALTALEAALNPAWREGLGDSRRVLVYLLRGSLAVVSAVLFLRTENLWLAILVHWGISAMLTALYRVFPGTAVQARASM